MIEVFPNPSQETIQVRSNSNLILDGENYSVTDLQGRVLDRGIYNSSLHVGELPSGYYLLRIGNETVRFLKE